MTPVKALWALLVGFLLLCCLPLTVPISTARAADPEQSGPLVHLISAPARVTPTSPVNVIVSVTAGSTPVPKGWKVLLNAQNRRLDSRAAVAGWSGTSLKGTVGTQLAAAAIDAPIAAGESRRFRFAVPAGRLDTSRWGPHGAAIVVVDEADTRRAVLRTYLITDPGTGQPARTKITVLLPMVATTIDPTTGYSAREQFNDTEPGGRLHTLLDIATGAGVVPVIDPAILTLSPDPAKAPPTPGAEPEEALTRWRERVRTALRTNPSGEVIGLDYADPDVAALSAAKQTKLLEEAKRLGTGTFTASSLNPRLDVAVPADGLADSRTIETLVQSGRSSAVVLNDTLQEPVSGTGWVTPTGRGTADYLDGELPSLLADTQLGEELAATTSTAPEGGEAATQRVLADLAAIATQDPGNARHLVVLAPRQWVPNAASVEAIRALTRGPSTRPATLADLTASAPRVERDQPELNETQRDAHLRSADVDEVANTWVKASTVLSALTDPQTCAEQQGRLATSLVSNHFRGRAEQWADARKQYRSTVSQLQNAIRVVPGSTITQVSQEVRLPVTVRNDTGSPATVRLQVVPASNRLVVTQQVEVKVAGKSRAVAYVPVRGVGNGDTSVRITLLAPNGAPLGEPATVRVKVRADWETVGTMTIGVIAALLLVVGLIRSVRRGPRVSRMTHDPLA